MIKIALAAALGLITLTSAANAQYHGDRLGNRREASQEQQIEQARRAGQLTGREYRQLQAEQARIDELQRRAQRDGRVDRHEAAEIRRAQGEAARNIYRESNDSDRRVSWGRRWW